MEKMPKIIVVICFIVGFGFVSICAWMGYVDRLEHTNAEYTDTSKAILIYKREVDAQINTLNAQLECYLTLDSLIKNKKIEIIVIE